LEDASNAVNVIAAELAKRGLETPLLFSSLALDISVPKIRSLIRSFTSTLISSSSSHPSYSSSANRFSTAISPEEVNWRQEVTFSPERELAWVMRWAMSRVLQVRGAVDDGHGGHVPGTREERRGLVEWEVYEEWRGREKGELSSSLESHVRLLIELPLFSPSIEAANYPPLHFRAFTAMLGPRLQPMFLDLFTLFSKLVAYSHIGGCVSTL
jgi:hypothetical protein